jgi:hypothetical protein
MEDHLAPKMILLKGDKEAGPFREEIDRPQSLPVTPDTTGIHP